MQKYNTVFLDADETLFDFKKSEKAAFTATLEHFGFKATDALTSLYHNINDGLWHEFEKGKITQAQLGPERFRLFCEETGHNIDPVLMNQCYAGELGNYSYILDGSVEFCSTLYKHCDLYIITNGMPVAQHGRFDKSPLKPYFKNIYISQEIGCRKPEKAYFDAVFKDLSFKESDLKRSVIVGDSLTSDILGGVNAGVDTIWYNPGSLPPRQDIVPTWTAKTYDEILNIIL